MIKQHSFSNPFNSVKEKFQKNGRSNSAPGSYDIYFDSKKVGNKSRLPSLSEDSAEEE